MQRQRREHRFVEGIEEKWCYQCPGYKPLGKFYIDRASSDYLQSICKVCTRINVKKWKKANPKKILKQNRRWSRRNPGRRTALAKEWFQTNPVRGRELRRQGNKRWKKANPEKYRQICQESYKRCMGTEKGHLSKIMSDAVYRSLRRNKVEQRWIDLVGFTLPQLIKHLKRTLPAGYTWEDYVAGKTDLHLDHIIPISVFNFSSPGDPDFRRCWNLGNLQLLPKLENIQKSDKLTGPFQPSFSFER